MNQQTYAENAYKLIRAEIIPSAPSEVIVTYGFPKGRHGKQRAIGQCFVQPVPEGTKAVIFIHPCQWTVPLDVLHVLTHEAVHAATPGTGHKGAFKALARSVGLEGPLTATHAGEDLVRRLNDLAERVGEFPSANFDVSQRKKQSTRLRLYVCSCPIKVRVASDDFDATCNICGSMFEQTQRPENGVE